MGLDLCLSLLKQVPKQFLQSSFSNNFHLGFTDARNVKSLTWEKNKTQGIFSQESQTRLVASRIKLLISLQWNILQPNPQDVFEAITNLLKFLPHFNLTIIRTNRFNESAISCCFSYHKQLTESLAWVSRTLFSSRGQGLHSTTLKEIWQHSAQVELFLGTDDQGKKLLHCQGIQTLGMAWVRT